MTKMTPLRNSRQPPPHETPDTKRKLRPELEKPKQQPIPVYDAATEARKAEFDKAARKWMADKEYESKRRGKAEAAYEEKR